MLEKRRKKKKEKKGVGEGCGEGVIDNNNNKTKTNLEISEFSKQLIDSVIIIFVLLMAFKADEVLSALLSDASGPESDDPLRSISDWVSQPRRERLLRVILGNTG